ncbi:hypothetical protein D3C85_1761320 [compost metagenome]
MAGIDKIANLRNDTIDDEILTFAFTKFFTKSFFIICSVFEAGFVHGIKHDAAKVDFRIPFIGEIIDGRALAASGETD